MGVEFKGSKKFQKKLDKLEHGAKELDGSHSVSFSELFYDGFMVDNTNFANINDFAEESGFDFSDSDSIDEKKLDEFVSSNTSFDSWSAMKSSAASKWTLKQLGL